MTVDLIELSYWFNLNIQTQCLVPTHSHNIELFLLISYVVVLNLKTMFHPATQPYQSKSSMLCHKKFDGFIFIALMILSKTDWIYFLTKGNAYRLQNKDDLLCIYSKLSHIRAQIVMHLAIALNSNNIVVLFFQSQFHALLCSKMRFDIVYIA